MPPHSVINTSPMFARVSRGGTGHARAALGATTSAFSADQSPNTPSNDPAAITAFIAEALQRDAAWTEVIDELNSELGQAH